MSLAFPKPQPRVYDRLAVKREQERKATLFRLHVWKRDLGVCRNCERTVIRSLELIAKRGEAHHIIPRSVEAVRYDVRNGILLCFICHEKATRYELRIIGTKFFRYPGCIVPAINANYKVRFVESKL